MTPRLPASALLLGIAGLLPFAALALATLRPSTPFATSMMTNPALFGLIAYGAVILAFLGGVHWGFALEPAVPAPRERLRLVLGVLPSLIGWVSPLSWRHPRPLWASSSWALRPPCSPSSAWPATVWCPAAICGCAGASAPSSSPFWSRSWCSDCSAQTLIFDFLLDF
jgi:hypothetical protein